MTSGTNSRARLWLSVVAILFIVVAAAILTQSIGFMIGQIISNGALVAAGALIVMRRPGNIIGPLLVANGMLWHLIVAAVLTAESLAEAGHEVAASWTYLVFAVLTVPVLWLFLPLLLLFPHGRTESVRTVRFLRASAMYSLALTLLLIFARPTIFGPGPGPYDHPFIDGSIADPLSEVSVPLIVALPAMQIAATVMLLARYRSGEAIERRQIGLVGYVALAYHILSILNFVVNPFDLDDRGVLFIDSLIYVLVPVAIGVAIFRYRLYDIDTIISRSVSYGALAVFIGGVYIGLVVGVGELLGGGSGFGLPIVASVLIAMAFQPVRRRVERWANRLVYGERATPYEVLRRFSRRSAELSDEQLLTRIPQLIVDGTGASTATLWTKTGDGFRTGSVWPTESADRSITAGKGFSDPEADYSLPIVHDGELLGGLSLVKAGGETVTPLEEDLLSDLASGMGLALRNARLTGQLRRQVADLEASRERVLSAADAARRTLENDLDSGPQQALVAVKVKLGPTRKRAEKAGAEKLAALLAQLETDAGEAIKAVREFAGGIYPPLLEAEGLAVAITQQAQKTVVPVSVRSDVVRRYELEVEAAVYFSVLEAMQNTAKYAEATSVSVVLTEKAGSLRFEVRDDGHGFDATAVARGAGLTGMADRLDTVGGSVTIDSSPGQGTVVTGSVPRRSLVEA